MGFVRDERAALAATMMQVGPDAPTLCGEWTVRDLAAHLVLREGRPDAMPGILLGPLSGYTEKVQQRIAAGDFDDLRRRIRTGPPWYSPFRLIDERANLAEFFVHHEDVRRAQPDWRPRELSASLEQALWKVATKIGRLGYRGAGVPVRIERLDGVGEQVVAGEGETVIVRGAPLELLLHAFGRDQVDVAIDGPAARVAVVAALDRGF